MSVHILLRRGGFNVRRYTKDFSGTTPRFAEANLAANLKLVDAVVGPQQTMAQNVPRRISQPSILEWRCRPPDGLNPCYAGPYSFDAFANPRFVSGPTLWRCWRRRRGCPPRRWRSPGGARSGAYSRTFSTQRKHFFVLF